MRSAGTPARQDRQGRQGHRRSAIAGKSTRARPREAWSRLTAASFTTKGGGEMKSNGSSEGLRELLCQALETEMGGIEVYRTALRCAVNQELKKEWEEYLEQTENHERIVRELFGTLGLDPETETPGRAIVRGKAE